LNGCKARTGRTATAKRPVNIIDFLARGSMEERLINNLIGKFEVASIVTGDGYANGCSPLAGYSEP
jgi:hypothetical protein